MKPSENRKPRYEISVDRRKREGTLVEGRAVRSQLTIIDHLLSPVEAAFLLKVMEVVVRCVQRVNPLVGNFSADSLLHRKLRTN